LSLSGPASLAAGAAATYTLTATKSGVNGQPMGMNVSTSDGTGLAVIVGQSTQLVGQELTHTSPPRTVSGTPTATGTYQFTFTMPGGAGAATAHTLRAAAVIDFAGGWQLTTFTVYVPPTPPGSVSASGETTSSVTLSWSGGGPEYRVVHKPGASAPSSPTDGTAADVGSNTATTVSGLTPGTQYSFAVYSKISGQAVFSATAATTTATTASALVSFVASTVAAGGNHTCALTSGGGIQCWGANGSGQLGNNGTTPQSLASTVSGLASGAVGIAAGFAHTCALTNAGGVKCWGRNDLGQLGDTSTTQRLTPVDVSGLASGVAAIAAGNHHTCALTAAGGVKCWGSGTSGEMGDNATSNRLAPVNVSGLASGVVAIAAGGTHTCALTTGGAAKCWGANDNGQVGDNSTTQRLVPTDVSGLGSGVAEITAGAAHTCARTASGAAKCWGDNNFGQLGDNSQVDRQVPTDVAGLGSGVAGIDAGSFHTCVLTTGGAIRCWGNNDNGPVGDGTQLGNRLVPTDTLGLSSGMAAVTAGGAHSCAPTLGGGVRCWGDNFSGQLGDQSNGNTRPAPVETAQFAGGVQQAAAGGNHSCAVTREGGARCWGSNANGRLGDNSTTQHEIPTDVAGLQRGVASVVAGFEHSCALTTAGGVKCWGRNNVGQLGDNSTTERLSPVDVLGLTSGVAAITAGFRHTCALTAAGGVKCWGSGTSGEMGDNATSDRLAPVDVSGLSSGVSAVSAGAAHTCALLSGGGMKCWGDNFYGAVGDNTQTQRLVPTDVSGLTSGVAEIAAGGSHTCARTSGGGVKCWGWNGYGQVGDNTQTDRHAPVDVPGLTSGVAAISSGNLHTCALTTGGGVKCWGNNGNGQVGDNTQFNNRLVPTDVTGLASGIAGITAGGSHTCASNLSGALSCWGNNFNGQLGDAGTTNRLTPVSVVALASGTQSLAFAPPAAGSVGAPINLSAPATSGLAAQFASWTPSTCTVSGGTATPSAAGLCGVRAAQPGNGSYPAAPEEMRLIAISAAPVNFALAVSKAGTGSGTVASSPAGTIDCGATCGASLASGTTVTLVATPAAGSSFTGWSGDCSGTGNCVVTMNAAKNVTATFALTNPPRLGNISTRMQVLTGNDVMIGGFVIGGSANKTVAIVATGPSLINFGITNPLANPTLRLVRSSDQAVVDTNDNWQSHANASQLQAAGFAPSHSLEAAIHTTLAPGAYTAIVEGVGGGTGVSVIGVYEVDGPTIPLINISTRGRVLTGNDVMIGGFVIQGSGSQTVAIVATGPSLAPFGIANPLANPTIRLVRSSDQTVIDSNDDWQSHANASQLSAAGFAPSNALEAGIYTTLPPGAYTVIVEGVNGGTGVAVIGVYAVQ
jgi:alpha-tubulin suppressor-like RCC1 family protein